MIWKYIDIIYGNFGYCCIMIRSNCFLLLILMATLLIQSYVFFIKNLSLNIFRTSCHPYNTVANSIEYIHTITLHSRQNLSIFCQAAVGPILRIKCPISVTSYATNLNRPAGWQSISAKPDKCNLFERGLVLRRHIIDGSVSLLCDIAITALWGWHRAYPHTTSFKVTNQRDEKKLGRSSG